MNKTKILLVTDSCQLQSGLSSTAKNILIPLLQKYGQSYEIHQLGWFAVPGKEQVPWPIYPTKTIQTPQGPQLDMNDRYGELSFDPICERVKPDIVLAYGDLWCWDKAICNGPNRNNYRLLLYYTIDGSPYYGELLANNASTWGKVLTKSDELVVLSHFGEKVLHWSCPELKDRTIHVRNHPMEMARYPNRTPELQQQLKEKLLPPVIAKDCWLSLWVGRNQFRKQNYKQWELCSRMVHGSYIECKQCNRITSMEWNPAARCVVQPEDNTMYDAGYSYDHCWHCKSKDIVKGTPMTNYYAWLHTSKQDAGYNCDTHDRMWKVENNVIYTNATNGMTGVSFEEMIALYQAADMMYTPTGGEGYQNPVAECMAAGTPIVYANYSSQAEIAKFGGLPVRVANYCPELGHSIWRSAVDTNHAVEQTLKLIRSKQLAFELGARGRHHMMRYDVNNMVDSWHTLFQSLAAKPLPSAGPRLYTTTV
jgi:hypothetical protein